MKALLSAFLIATALSSPANANITEQDWPCVQRKVDELSVAVMWPLPMEQVALEEAAEELADTLSLRRVTLEEADAYVATFVQATPNIDAALLGSIFTRVFDTLANERRRVMDGITTYAQQQSGLTAKINQIRAEMDKLLAAESPDFDKIDTLEETLDWDERIFRDRERSLTYVCETPVLLEKRIYALAQILLKYVPD